MTISPNPVLILEVCAIPWVIVPPALLVKQAACPEDAAMTGD